MYGKRTHFPYLFWRQFHSRTDHKSWNINVKFRKISKIHEHRKPCGRVHTKYITIGAIDFKYVKMCALHIKLQNSSKVNWNSILLYDHCGENS